MLVLSSVLPEWGGHNMERRGKCDVDAQREADGRGEESEAGKLRELGKMLWFRVRFLVPSSRISCGHVESPTSRFQFRSQVL